MTVSTKDLHIVGFRIGRETFGVPIELVHEIVRVPEITAVPDSPGCKRRMSSGVPLCPSGPGRVMVCVG